MNSEQNQESRRKKRDTSKDPGGFKNLLLKCEPVWRLVAAIRPLRRLMNKLILKSAIKAIPDRPEPHCNHPEWSYTTWEGLSNRRWASRHLPPAPQLDLPDAAKVAEDLFSRGTDGCRESPKSTLVFPYFAQWFVDGFLVGDQVERRRNYSSHAIDLCQLYGLHPELTDLIREKKGGRLKSQQIDDKGEFAPFLYDANGDLKKEYSIRREGYQSFVDIIHTQIHVEKEPGEIGSHVPNSPIKYGYEFPNPDDPDNPVQIPRHYLFNEIPRPEKVHEWQATRETDPESLVNLQNIFAIANDRGNSTLGFTLMSTLMLREHNRIAGLLDSAYGWDDERTFQTTRNILIVILLKVVIEEYINHIAPYHFKLFVDPEKFFKAYPWKWQNWMTTEFQLLYRWHPMIPDELEIGDPEKLPSIKSLWNPGLIVEKGVAGMLQHASNQAAGEIGPRNTWKWLIDFAEVPSINMGRHSELAPYNDYRELCGMKRVDSFCQITADEQVQAALKKHYGSVDKIEYYTGIFSEDVRDNAALGPLIGMMVAADAFSQALPNPLLQRRTFNKETFSSVGWDIINGEKHTIESIVKRNSAELSSEERDKLWISMTRKGWQRI